jgi:hypothetical protein
MTVKQLIDNLSNIDGEKISRKNIQAHSFKEIRKSHNIHKMLVVGSFNWL